MARMRWAPTTFLACVGLSCASPSLRARAGADLRCEEDQIQVTKITEKAQNVSGCGQHATYVKKCDDCASPPGMAP
jgi:hypothetical protein